MAPANFNGTAYIYSHGYRPNILVAAGIPLVGGLPIIDLPEPVPGGSPALAAALLGKGFGIMGSGFSRQGWNADEAVKTNIELIDIFKKQNPKTTKVIAWGNSLGGFITQALAEARPDLISAAAPMCTASNVIPMVNVVGDALWGMKTFFDPSIKGGNYSAGAAGVAEANLDMQKVLGVALAIQAAMAVNATAPAWPATATAVPAALKAIPSRSAIMLVALMAGLPMRSAHLDSTSAPSFIPEASQTSYRLAINPTLATLENIATAAVIGILITHDIEQRVGGAFFDNSATNYTNRVEEERYVWNAALSGNTAINGMLGFLAAAPRMKANPAAVTKLNAMLKVTGKISDPTIFFTGSEDPVTFGGNQQWFLDRYEEQYAAEWAKNKKDRVRTRPVNKVMAIWDFPPEKYTKFLATGLPDTSFPAVNGTNHCNFTASQYLAIAELLAYASANDMHVSGGALLTKLRKAKNMTIDRDYKAPALKYFTPN